MTPLKLSLKNFLSYGEPAISLDFRNFSVACLSGKNGHGKSALIDAITWALWGKCRVKNKEEVIKRGTSEAGVEFEFEVDGNRYRVLRSVVRRKGVSTSATADFQIFDPDTEGFKPLSQGGKTQDEIGKILKMDYDSFICSSFILQGKADEFTRKAPAERKEILAGILDLDKYERLSKSARDQYQRSKLEGESSKREADEIESHLLRKDNLDGDLESTKAEEEKIGSDLKEVEKLHEWIIRESESLNAKMETYNSLIRDKNEVEKECARIEKELDKVTLEIGKDKAIIIRSPEILEGFVEFERVREEEKSLSGKLIRYTNLIKEREKINRRINEDKAELEKKISTLTGKREELQKRLGQIAELLKREMEIKTGFEEFLETRSLFNEFEKKREASEKLISKRRELEYGIEKIKFQLDSQIKELESKIKLASERAGSVEKLSRECEALRAEIRASEEIRKKSETLRERLKEMGEEKKVSIWRKSEFERKNKEEIQKLAVLKSEADDTHCPLCESPLEEEARRALVEKIEKSLVGIESALIEETKKINRIEKEEAAITAEIKQADSHVRKLTELHKSLGERERDLEDSLSGLKDLESAKQELRHAQETLVREDFGAENREGIKEVIERISTLGYDERTHGEIKERVESLKPFEMENAVLEKEKENKTRVETELSLLQTESAPLKRTLEENLFAQEHKEKAREIERQIAETGYDEKRHREVQASLKSLENFSREKETLDRAKLNLSHREKERESLNSRFEAGKDRLKKTEKEIKELEGIVTQSEAILQKKRQIEDDASRLRKTKDEKLQEKTRIINELERIAKLKEKKEEILERIQKLGYDSVVYQELDKAFGKNGIQAFIIESAVPEIDIEANKILNKLTEGSMALSLEMVKPTQKGGEKETLDIKIADSSGTRSYETYSGGEAFRIDFALRVAISKFIANRSGALLRTLVIDEGFGTQDKDGLSQFVQVINAIKDDFDKIFVITHVDELKDKFPVRIEVTKEPGKGSSFEVIYS